MSDERIERLERSVRRIWLGLLAITVAMSAIALGNASPSKKLTLRELRIVDAEGHERFVMATAPNGGAVFSVSDNNAQPRVQVTAGTPNDAGTIGGSAGCSLVNREGKEIWSETSP
jgi:hypothetical protein